MEARGPLLWDRHAVSGLYKPIKRPKAGIGGFDLQKMGGGVLLRTREREERLRGGERERERVRGEREGGEIKRESCLFGWLPAHIHHIPFCSGSSSVAVSENESGMVLIISSPEKKKNCVNYQNPDIMEVSGLANDLGEHINRAHKIPQM